MKTLNQRGFTLTEVIAAVVLVGLLGYGFAMAMLMFITSYQETRDYVQLQQDMVNAINTIRHGYIAPRVDTPLFGLLTATDVFFNDARNSVHVVPLDADFAIPQWAIYFLDSREGSLKVSGMFHMNTIRGDRIFPSSDVKIGNQNKFQITQLRFEDATRFTRNISVVKFTITGSVRFRQARRGQSTEEDLRQNVRFATFEVVTYLGNSDKSLEDN
jgi:prepilin-type N-terminal cleavage/methylation domain-containing protein